MRRWAAAGAEMRWDVPRLDEAVLRLCVSPEETDAAAAWRSDS